MTDRLTGRPMDRREALARMIAATGGLVIGGQFLALTGCSAPPVKPRTEKYTPDELSLMDDIADTILPETDTPGARAAGCGPVMAALAHACYDNASFAEFRRGLGEVQRESRTRYGKTFGACTSAQRTALLDALDADQRAAAKRKDEGRAYYMTLMKELTRVGYFTSELGGTRALRYVETPGRFDGNVPYRAGEHAWADPIKRIG